MKKFNLDPMGLDKETIALLDERQLQEIMGGQTATPGTTSGCGTGTTDCDGGGAGTTSGCGTGGTKCTAVAQQDY